MKIPQKTPKAVRALRNLFFLIALNISCHLSLSNMFLMLQYLNDVMIECYFLSGFILQFFYFSPPNPLKGEFTGFSEPHLLNPLTRLTNQSGRPYSHRTI
jgi:hypothetical protein